MTPVHAAALMEIRCQVPIAPGMPPLIAKSSSNLAGEGVQR
jgi:hypothetical protein